MAAEPVGGLITVLGVGAGIPVGFTSRLGIFAWPATCSELMRGETRDLLMACAASWRPEFHGGIEGCAVDKPDIVTVDVVPELPRVDCVKGSFLTEPLAAGF